MTGQSIRLPLIEGGGVKGEGEAFGFSGKMSTEMRKKERREKEGGGIGVGHVSCT